jgi:hypothetical protein
MISSTRPGRHAAGRHRGTRRALRSRTAGSAPAGPPVGRLVAAVGVDGPTGVAVVHALRAAGHRVLAMDTDPEAAGLALVGPAGAAEVLSRSAGYVRTVLYAVERHRPDALVCAAPSGYGRLESTTAGLAALGCRTWFPPAPATALCLDRAAFARTMRDAGVPIAAGGRRPGRAFTADVLVARDGTLLTCVPRWYLAPFDSPALVRVVADAVRAVGVTGPAAVRGFVTGHGQVCVIQVEPGFSGGLSVTLAAGADVVGTYVAGILDPEFTLPHLAFDTR